MKVKRDVLRAMIQGEDSTTSGRQVARYSGVHPSFIDHLLSGRRSSCTPQVADRIAEALRVPTGVLFDEVLTSTKPSTAKCDAPRKVPAA
ncbi:hypothetical protein A5717_26275 [Mycolicibacterium porcinum]|nr:hypothetical protein A5717_26275 [Mycolicibacterium porcinum]